MSSKIEDLKKIFEKYEPYIQAGVDGRSVYTDSIDILNALNSGVDVAETAIVLLITDCISLLDGVATDILKLEKIPGLGEVTSFWALKNQLDIAENNLRTKGGIPTENYIDILAECTGLLGAGALIVTGGTVLAGSLSLASLALGIVSVFKLVDENDYSVDDFLTDGKPIRDVMDERELVDQVFAKLDPNLSLLYGSREIDKNQVAFDNAVTAYINSFGNTYERGIVGAANFLEKYFQPITGSETKYTTYDHNEILAAINSLLSSIQQIPNSENEFKVINLSGYSSSFLRDMVGWSGNYPRDIRFAIQNLSPIAILQASRDYPVASDNEVYGEDYFTDHYWLDRVDFYHGVMKNNFEDARNPIDEGFENKKIIDLTTGFEVIYQPDKFSVSSHLIKFGTKDNDDIFGYEKKNTFYGGEGNDTLTGWTGEDYLEGGFGNDSISGNEGADSLYGMSGNDSSWWKR